LAPAERVVLLEAVLLLPLVAAALRTVGLRRTLAALPRPRPARPGSTRLAAARIAEVVRLTASYGPYRAACFERSLTLCALLRRHGVVGELCIGFRHQGDALAGHAWLEHEGRVLIDTAEAVEAFPVVLRERDLVARATAPGAVPH
jgi:hypothetical protein